LVLLATAGCGRSTRLVRGTGAPEPGVDASTSCLAAPDVEAGSAEDLSSLAEPLERAPGSELLPLPLDPVIASPGSAPCRDGTGSIWFRSATGLARFDADLALQSTFEVEGSLFTCDEGGAILAELAPLPPYEVTVRRFDATGLVSELVVSVSYLPNALRATPLGPVLVFSPVPLTVNDVSYSPPADATRLPGSSSPPGLYRLEAGPDEPRMFWFADLGFDARGVAYASHGLEDGSGTLVIERFSPDGERLGSHELFGSALGIRASHVFPEGGVILLVSGSLLLDLGEAAHRLQRPRYAVLALNEQLELVWGHAFGGPGDESVNGLSVFEDGSVWVHGAFEEWVEVDGRIAYGHVGTTDGISAFGWGHRFVARFGAEGELSALAALGALGVGDQERVVALDAETALVVGTTPALTSGTAEPQFGSAGELPASFVGKLSTAALPAPLALPELPRETLPELSLEGLPGSVERLMTSGHGLGYVVLREDERLWFVDASSLESLPPFVPPDNTSYPRIALDGDDLFYVDSGAEAAWSVRHYQRTDDDWLELGPLPFESTSTSACADVSAFGDWLFVPCGVRTFAFRRRGSSYELEDDQLHFGGAVAFDGRRLAIGDRNETDQRAYGGAVYLYSLGASGFGAPVRLTASDSLPYDPGMPCGGDYCPGPPDGKGFGSTVDVRDDRVLVGNAESEYYVFEPNGGGWVERWKQSLPGFARLHGDAILVAGSDARGRTTGSGALRVFEEQAGAWVERQRVVPAQRWESHFGRSIRSADGRLLIEAAGYGKSTFSTAIPGGKVFALDFADCP
jgi:hypothetical protein